MELGFYGAGHNREGWRSGLYGPGHNREGWRSGFMARAIIAKGGARGFMARAIIAKGGGRGFMARAIKPLLAGLLAATIVSGEAAAAERLSFAIPGVPPVFSGLVAVVAKEEGCFKKYGVEVDVRPLDSGAAAAQAVVAGNID